MKVLMIAPTPFFADRGCHAQIYEEIKALQRIGHEIIICTYGLGRDVPDVNIVRTLNCPWYKKLSAGPSRTKMLLLPFLTITVLRTILSFKPDIIHAHLHEGAIIAYICRLFFKEKKYLFDMQGSLTGEVLQHGFAKEGSLFHRFLMSIEKKTAGCFFVITQSDSMINELMKLGASPERIANVKDGVDTDIFKPQPFSDDLALQIKIDKNKPRILYMGLLEEYQGTDLMLEAFEDVAAQLPDVQFIIIGYPNIEKYQAICKKRSIADKTFFLGRVDYHSLPKYLSLANIAIAPKISITEGDGKIYNYMAMGMLTIAWDRSVSREILAETGIFAEYKNPKALADKIIWAIKNPDARKLLGTASRERAVANLSWDAVGKRINAVYAML